MRADTTAVSAVWLCPRSAARQEEELRSLRGSPRIDLRAGHTRYPQTCMDTGQAAERAKKKKKKPRALSGHAESQSERHLPWRTRGSLPVYLEKRRRE